MRSASQVPKQLRVGIAAVLMLTGVIGGSAFLAESLEEVRKATEIPYIQAAAQDDTISDAVKVAMVMGSFYESSYRHIGKPYKDMLGNGQPWTVCNGLTGKDVIPYKYYSPELCFKLEKERYIKYERFLKKELPAWNTYTVFQQASFLDFIHNKGEGNFQSSTMKRLALAGNIEASCLQNTRWNKGRVNNVLTVLPGLEVRGNANAELCKDWK